MLLHHSSNGGGIIKDKQLTGEVSRVGLADVDVDDSQDYELHEAVHPLGTEHYHQAYHTLATHEMGHQWGTDHIPHIDNTPNGASMGNRSYTTHWQHTKWGINGELIITKLHMDSTQQMGHQWKTD